TGLDNQIASLNETISGFTRGLENVPQEQVAYARLRREQQLVEEIYTLLQMRLKEAEIREAEDRSDVRIVDAALVPGAPVTPRPVLNLLLGILAGVTIGVTIVVVRGMMDPRVRTRQDVISASDGVPVLGMIPHIPQLGDGASTPSQSLWRF